MRLDDPRDPERVACRLQRHLIVTAEAQRKQRQPRRLGLHPSGQAQLASLRDRDLAEVAIDVQPDEAHQHQLHSRLTTDRDEAGDATTTDPCARHTRTVAGAATYKQRARSP